MLNEQIPGDDDELPDHDFDIVQHTGCDYDDNGKGLQLDVEKILGTSQKEVIIYLIELGSRFHTVCTLGSRVSI